MLLRRRVTLLGLSLFTLLVNLGPAAATVIAGPITNPGNGHAYYLLSQNTWQGAEAESVSLGGHLVAIADAAENSFVFSTFGNYLDIPRAFWIGLTDEDQEGVFVWSNGEPLTYMNWLAGEPNNEFGAEDWVEMLPNSTWNDLPILDTDGGGNPLLAVAETPEPSTFLLLTLGLLSFGLKKKGLASAEGEAPALATRGDANPGAEIALKHRWL